MDESARPRIGFVGLGGWGTRQANTVSDLGGEVAAGADVKAAARTEFESAFDAPTVERYEDLPYGDLDGVVVGTPNAFHAPAAIEALERDVPAYVAKPMADSLAAAEEMRRAERESEAWGMIGFVSRFDPGVALFEASHERGTFGDVSHAEVEVIRRRGIPGVGSWFCSEDLAGGGSLYDIGVHAIDKTLYMLGFPDPVEVCGVARTQFGTREDYADPDGWNENWDLEGEAFTVDDSASAFVRFADGTTMTVETAWAANREPSQSVVIRGTDAGAVLHGDGDLEINAASRSGTDHYVDTTLSGDLEHTGHAGAQSVFLDALRAGERPGTCTFDEGLVTQRIMDAIYESGERGAAVRLD
jgi:predicted dehydrogenase